MSSVARPAPEHGALTALPPRPLLSAPAEEFYAKISAAATIFAAVLVIGNMLRPGQPHAIHLLGPDFANTWMGARSALGGGPAMWFDVDVFNMALRDVFGPDYPAHVWSYPPHLVLFVWPLGLLPYVPAYAAWCAAGLAVYFCVASAGGQRRDWLLLIASPAVLITLVVGQIAFFTTALMIAGLANLERRPVIAGILFGILTVKPQLGILLPLMLALRGDWRAIGAAVTATLVLASATAAAFGPHIWTAFAMIALPFQGHVVTQENAAFLTMMPTAFGNIRVTGLPLALAAIVQGVLSIGAIAAVVWTFWRRRDPVLSVALFVAASFVATPYILNYDLVIFSWVIVLLGQRADNAPLDHCLALAALILPITTVLLGVAGIPGSALVLVAFAARLIWRLAADQTPYATAANEPVRWHGAIIAGCSPPGASSRSPAAHSRSA